MNWDILTKPVTIDHLQAGLYMTVMTCEGHWFRGQGQTSMTKETFECRSSWTSEGITIKPYWLALLDKPSRQFCPDHVCAQNLQHDLEGKRLSPFRWNLTGKTMVRSLRLRQLARPRLLPPLPSSRRRTSANANTRRAFIGRGGIFVTFSMTCAPSSFFLDFWFRPSTVAHRNLVKAATLLLLIRSSKPATRMTVWQHLGDLSENSVSLQCTCLANSLSLTPITSLLKVIWV